MKILITGPKSIDLMGSDVTPGENTRDPYTTVALTQIVEAFTIVGQDIQFPAFIRKDVFQGFSL